jgi:hypothetical protein
MPSSKHILNELSAISQTVANITDRPVFTVPENYFAQFPEKLMSKIREDAQFETTLISPLLGGLERKTPFNVPEGYFSALEDQLKKAVLPAVTPETAPVIPMFRKRQVWKLSVAAMLAGIIGISAWFYFQQAAAPFSPAQVNVKAELPKVSEDEITDFLLSVPEMPQAETPQVAGLNNLNVEDMLKDVQDGELQDFVKEMPDLQTEKLN